MSQKKSVFSFVAAGLLIFAVILFMAAKRQGWFSASVEYSIEFPSGEGLFVGTPVTVAGLKAGQVKNVELAAGNKVVVAIKVQKKFSTHIKNDSRVVLGRPFIIGEKVIAVSPGSDSLAPLAEHSVLKGEETLEITDLLSGGRLSPYFKTFETLMEQFRIIIEGDGKKNTTVSLIELYRQTFQSLKTLEDVSRELKFIRTEFATSPDTKKLIRELAQSSGQLSSVLAKTDAALPEFTLMSREFGRMAPELSKALTETVFTLQAMQRSFVLSGGVARLKEEKAKSDRAPASTTPSP